MTKKPSQRVLICAMAATPHGATNCRIAEEAGVPRTSIPQHMLALVKQGRIFQARRPGCKLRWFDTAERASEWAKSPRMVPSEYMPVAEVRQPREVLPKRPAIPVIRCKAGEAPGVTLSKTDWKGRPVDLSTAILMIFPPCPQSRWDAVEIAPDARYPAFSAQRYGA